MSVLIISGLVFTGLYFEFLSLKILASNDLQISQALVGYLYVCSTFIFYIFYSVLYIYFSEVGFPSVG